MAAELETEGGRSGEGQGADDAGAAFFIATTFGHALQSGEFATVWAFAGVEGPKRWLGGGGDAGPGGLGILGDFGEERGGGGLSPGEELGWRRESTLEKAVVEELLGLSGFKGGLQ
jgi:hypothetical protein